MGYYTGKLMGVQAETAQSNWWSLDGTITSCVAAYQPKGASSYVKSLVNLTGNSAYNAIAGNAPSWNATDGWIFNSASSQYLKTGVTPNSLNWSFIVKMQDLDTNDTWVLGYYTTQGFGVQANFANNVFYYNGNSYSISRTISTGILAVAKNQGYYNGTANGGTWYQIAHTAGEIWIGDISGQYRRYFNGYIQAVAIYNDTLTPTQIANLTTAINAL